MASLLDLLGAYPVVEALASCLGLGDIINLSRVNSLYRATLHGFRYESLHNQSALFVGQHKTRYWENLKSKSILRCAESRHKPNTHAVKSCRICSFPVCEACIIRDSFAKRKDNTFHSRYRNMCPTCWRTGNQHKRQSFGTAKPEVLGTKSAASQLGRLCACTAKDGDLCLACKTAQNKNLDRELAICYGDECSATRNGAFEGRICIWCDLPLPGGRSRAEARREYDAKHLQAKTHW